MSYNLGSKNNIRAPLNRKNILRWFKNEIKDLEPHLQEIVLGIFLNSESLCNFPKKSFLLWNGCDRKRRYHAFPNSIKKQARQKRISLNNLSNGPALVAFELAGGIRPARYGSNNKWSVHHLYSGKFPYLGKDDTLHAAQDGRHFTQAAGLVALHPLADALADENPAFTWFLRYNAYKKFRYDPDHVFAEKIDKYGFDQKKK